MQDRPVTHLISVLFHNLYSVDETAKPSKCALHDPATRQYMKTFFLFCLFTISRVQLNSDNTQLKKLFAHIAAISPNMLYTLQEHE